MTARPVWGKSDPELKTQLCFLQRVLSFQNLGQKPPAPWPSFALLFLSSVINSNPLLFSLQKGSGKQEGWNSWPAFPALLHGEGCLPGALFRRLGGGWINPHLGPQAANQRAITPGTICINSPHLPWTQTTSGVRAERPGGATPRAFLSLDPGGSPGREEAWKQCFWA